MGRGVSVTLAENAVTLNDSNLSAKNLPYLLALIANQEDTLKALRETTGVPIIIAGHLNQLKASPSNGNTVMGDAIDAALVSILMADTAAYKRILLKLTASKKTNIKKNQRLIAIIAHNGEMQVDESSNNTPVISFIFNEHTYSIQWNKETLRSSYPNISTSSNTGVLALMFSADAFSISEASIDDSKIVEVLRVFSTKKTQDTLSKYVKRVAEDGVQQQRANIIFWAGVISGASSTIATSTLFTALLPALVSGAA